MSIAAKQVKVPQDSHSHVLKKRLPERLQKQNESSWQSLARPPAPRELTLLEVMGGVWTFQDEAHDRRYRCEIDPDGTERWFSKVISMESELISQSDAARLIGVSRQAIRSAIVHERLRTVNCNGRPMVHRAEVLALPIDRKRARKQSQST